MVNLLLFLRFTITYNFAVFWRGTGMPKNFFFRSGAEYPSYATVHRERHCGKAFGYFTAVLCNI